MSELRHGRSPDIALSLVVALFAATVSTILISPGVAQAHDASVYFTNTWQQQKSVGFSFTTDFPSALRPRVADGAGEWTNGGTPLRYVQNLDVAPFSGTTCDFYQNDAIHWANIDGAGNILASTGNACLFNGTHEFYSQQITFDSSENWYTGTGIPSIGQIDTWATAAHEFGHMSGFAPAFNGGHFPDNDPTCTAGPATRSTMCSTYFGIEMRSLQFDHDLHTFQAAYPNSTLVNVGTVTEPLIGDFDGDGKADYAVFRPSWGADWYVQLATGATPAPLDWGQPGDTPIVADFNGDGKDDFGIYRGSAGGADWWVQYSTGTSPNIGGAAAPPIDWGGQPGDLPLVADYDGDGKADLTIWRPSSPGADWYVRFATGATFAKDWGQPGDVPIPTDFDGDGKDDYVVWRPSSSGVDWYIAFQNFTVFNKDWGQPGDVPVRADLDGDGKDDYVVWRPSTGAPGTDWYVQFQTSATFNKDWGQPGDLAVPADFDGDGKDDYVVWRPGSGLDWYIAFQNLTFFNKDWGQPGDLPT